MADFKTALIALSKGELDYEIVAENIGRILNRQPALAVDVLEQLQDAYNAGIIDPELFAQFKAYVTQLSLRENPEVAIADEARAALAKTGDFDLNLDFDLSPVTENPQRKSQTSADSEKAHTDTSWPAEKPAKEARRADPGPKGIIGPGSVLKGRFQLDNILGVGGMGTVFRGRDLIKVEARDKNPYVALKILNEDFKDHPDAFIALQREASRQQKLAHPNIATVYDFDRTEDGTFFLTMELLEGEPLNKFIKHTVKPQGGLPFDQAFPMIEGLAKALIYAHERDIAHSDFKPGNCFITKDGTMKVLDFGIARAVKTPGQSDTEKTIFDPGKLGALTPPYASVEMLEEQEPDTRDDIYALACVAYELLTGKHPFNKLRATAARDNDLIPVPIKGIKKSQNKAINRGLGFTRAQRSQSVTEFITQLRGRTSAFGNPWISIPSVAVILAAVGIFPLIGLMQEREMNRLIDALQSQKPATIEQTLAHINQETFDPEMRDRVLVASRTEVLDYFDTKIQEKINVEEQKFDFSGARALIDRLGGFAVFSDSAQVALWKSAVENTQSEVLNAQSALFNEALSFDRLLDLDDQSDVHDVLRVVAVLDPGLTETFRKRLPGAYSAAIERAIVNEEYERAVSLSQAGLKLLPNDSYLSNLADKISGEQEKAQLRADLVNATASINDTLAIGNRLADFYDIQTATQKLAFFEREHPLLDKLRQVVSRFAEQEIAHLKQSRSAEPEDVAPYIPEQLHDFGLLYKSLRLDSLYFEHNELIDQISNDLVSLFTQLRDAILDPTTSIRSPKILELVTTLSSYPNNHPLVLDGLEMTARWALTMARRARSLGNLEAALSDLEQLNLLIGNRIPMPFVADEKQIIIALKNNNAVHYVQNSDEQEAQFQRLAEEFLGHLETTPESVADMLSLLESFDSLAATDPASARLTHFKSSLLEMTLAAYSAAEDGGDIRTAGEIARRTHTYLPESNEIFARALAATELAPDNALNIPSSELIALKNEASSLINLPTAERAWNQRLQQLLLVIEGAQTSDDGWLAESKNSIAQALISQAKLAMEAKQFAKSANLLWRARPYTQNEELIEATESALVQASKQFSFEQRTRERDARIVGLKKDLETQIHANDLRAATKTFNELQRIAPPDDSFAQTSAPKLLSETYLRVSKDAASRGDFATALAIAKAGAQILPTENSLRSAINEYSVRGNSQELARVFAVGGAFDLGLQLERISEVRQLDPAYFAENETPWAIAVAERIQQLKIEKNPLVDDYIVSAKSIFPSIAIIQNLSATKLADDDKLTPAREITSAQDSGRLSLARRLLENLSTTEKNEAEIANLKVNQQALSDRAVQYFDEYKTAFSTNKFDVARKKLTQALNIWQDNVIFIEHDARMKENDAPSSGGNLTSLNVSGTKCMHKLAGQGKRFAGSCYDMISGTTRGPLLVVVPSEDGKRGEFAIGKYETTVGDFNTFCKDTANCPTNDVDAIDLPVRNVGYDQIQNYLLWLNEKTRANYRLPTKREWRYAASANDEQPRKDVNCQVVQNDTIIMGQTTIATDSGKANGWGMYNYVGNVQELATGEGGLYALGGSFSVHFDDCQIETETRHSGDPDNQTGFRVVRELH